MTKCSYDDYYKTKRIAYVKSSINDSLSVGEYAVYMDNVSTFGIIDDAGTFIPLRLAHLYGVQWEYVNG